MDGATASQESEGNKLDTERTLRRGGELDTITLDLTELVEGDRIEVGSGWRQERDLRLSRAWSNIDILRGSIRPALRLDLAVGKNTPNRRIRAVLLNDSSGKISSVSNASPSGGGFSGGVSLEHTVAETEAEELAIRRDVGGDVTIEKRSTSRGRSNHKLTLDEIIRRRDSITTRKSFSAILDRNNRDRGRENTNTRVRILVFREARESSEGQAKRNETARLGRTLFKRQGNDIL